MALVVTRRAPGGTTTQALHDARVGASPNAMGCAQRGLETPPTAPRHPLMDPPNLGRPRATVRFHIATRLSRHAVQRLTRDVVTHIARSARPNAGAPSGSRLL